MRANVLRGRPNQVYHCGGSFVIDSNDNALAAYYLGRRAQGVISRVILARGLATILDT